MVASHSGGSRLETAMTTRDTPWERGTPCWIELMTNDLPGAVEFYGGVFGMISTVAIPEGKAKLKREMPRS